MFKKEKPKVMIQKPGRYCLRVFGAGLKFKPYAELFEYEGLTPKDGYVEWQMDSFEERGNEVFDAVDGQGTLILSWKVGTNIDDLWEQIAMILDDQTCDTIGAEIAIEFHPLDRCVVMYVEDTSEDWEDALEDACKEEEEAEKKWDKEHPDKGNISPPHRPRHPTE